MNTPATTPAPQKITPDCQPVFPCWIWTKPQRKVGFWQKVYSARLFDADRFGGRPCVCDYWLPDSLTPPTCTPSEGEKQFFHCDGCAPEFACWNTGAACRHPECIVHAQPPSTPYPAPQPTHSAQEAALAAARECWEGELHLKTTEFIHSRAAIILRHFPSQPAEPSVSPGSGEALREAQAKLDEARAQLNDVWEAMHQDPRKFKPSNPWSALAHARALEYRKVSAERNAFAADFRDVAGRFCDEHRSPGSVQPGCPECARLAQPATPPLPSGEDGEPGLSTCCRAKYQCKENKKWIDRELQCVGTYYVCDKCRMACDVEEAARLAPPLPSGEDADWKALFGRHTEAVGAFLNELYAIMVDPLADGKMEVSEMKAALIEAAKRSRDQSAPPLPTIGDGKDGLKSALEEIARCCPATDGQGALYHMHFDENGNELGPEYVDPMAVIQHMQGVAHRALSADSPPADAGREEKK